MRYDVIIIGAGPAGLFAAHELITLSKKPLRIAIIDRGYRASLRRCPLLIKSLDVDFRFNFRTNGCSRCTPCHIMHGVGGAGIFSSGTINLRPDVGGDLDKLIGSWRKAEELIRYVDEVFVKFGAPKERLFRVDDKLITELERLAARAGAKFIPTPQRHIGSDNTVRVIENMSRYLEQKGVKFILSLIHI